MGDGETEISSSHQQLDNLNTTTSSMTIYDLFIYDRFGQCLIHRPYNQPAPGSNPGKKTTDRPRLIFGLVYTMQAFVNKFAPPAPDSGSSQQLPVQEPLLSFNTPQHKVHVLTLPTGLSFVLTTDVKYPTATDLLKKIYKLFVDYVTSTPHYTQGNLLESTPEQFLTKLDQLIASS
jgi:hypothetical protein